MRRKRPLKPYQIRKIGGVWYLMVVTYDRAHRAEHSGLFQAATFDEVLSYGLRLDRILGYARS